MSTCLAELPGSLIARSNGTGHDPAVPTWVLHSTQVHWNCRLVQNDQFAAHPPISPVLHWFDRGDVTATAIKERKPLFPTSTQLSHINTRTTVAHPPNRPCVTVSLTDHIMAMACNSPQIHKPRFTTLALPPLTDQGQRGTKRSMAQFHRSCEIRL